jgi:hypothetical protein
MSDKDINKAYVSPYDKFMFRFDVEHELSASQKKEIKKHERIFKLRDNAQSKESEQKIWEKF